MIVTYDAVFFKPSEFDCKCKNHDCPAKGSTTPIDPLLIIGLNLIRKKLKMPLRVNSGRRCTAHNAIVGGATSSRHLNGHAADISAADYDKLVAVAVSVCSALGLKVLRYDNQKFLHIQV